MMEAIGGGGSNPLVARDACRRIRALDRQLLGYAELDDALAGLQRRPRHDVVVPISEVAFVPGEIRDTNCILALIGDQTFVEKTNSGARQLVDRRRRRFEQERAALLPLLTEQVVEIREEYVDEDEAAPVVVQASKAQAADPSESFEESWSRLGNDQLEAEEQKQQEAVPQLHGFFARSPKATAAGSSTNAGRVVSGQASGSSAVAPANTDSSGPAPRKVSRFKAQRQQLSSN